MRRASFQCIVAALLAGCGGAAPAGPAAGRDGGTGGIGDGGNGVGGGGGAAADQGIPVGDGGNGSGGTGNIVFLSFGTNTTTVTEKTTSLVFTAVLTDPKGPTDIVGGTLVSPDGKIHYGAFVTSHTQGAYELSIGWSAINDAAPLTFVTSTTRTFEADFFDSAGNKAWRTVDVTLQCSGGVAACSGRCGSGGGADDPRGCGGCPTSCCKGTSCNACVAEQCDSTLSAVSVPVSNNPWTTCQALCASQQATCVTGCGDTGWASANIQQGSTTYTYSSSCATGVKSGDLCCCKP